MNAAFSVISFLLSVSLQEEISYRTISPIHFFSFLLYPSLLSLPTFIPISHLDFSLGYLLLAIFVILLHINITKLKKFLRQIAISHKYFIHNDLLI